MGEGLEAGGLAGWDRREFMRAEMRVAPAWKKDEREGLWPVAGSVVDDDEVDEDDEDDEDEDEEASFARNLVSSASYSVQRWTAAAAFWLSWKTWDSSSAMRAWASRSCMDGGSFCGGMRKPQLGQHDGLGSTKSEVVLEAAVMTIVDDMAWRLCSWLMAWLPGFRCVIILVLVLKKRDSCPSRQAQAAAACMTTYV